MARPKHPVPAYKLHKPSGQARARIAGRDYYLGKFGSPESLTEYERVCSEVRAAATAKARSDTAESGEAPVRPRLTVNELLLSFLGHSERHYRRPDGTVTKEVQEYKAALRIVRELYGHTSAAAFGPLALQAVRKRMVEAGWCRTRVNKQVGRVKRAFKWAAGAELVPASVFLSLAAVEGLRRGRSDAVERPKVLPVADADVEAVLPFMTPTVRAMVELQRLTGMRPGEVRHLTPGEVDTSGDLWVYRPGSRQAVGNKMAYLDRDRAVYLGPKARAVLAPWLDGRRPDERAFTPARSKAEWWAMLRAKRKSKVTPSQVNRRKPADQLKKKWNDRWTDYGYAQAVAKACKRAGVEPFAPNRIRHLVATEVRARYGLEAAGAVLGHAKMSATEVYAERDQALALKVAAEAG